MTENVRKEMLKDIKDGYIDEWDNLAIDELFKQIEKEHEEIQQYRAIGTLEDMAFYKKCYDEESYEYCGEYGRNNCGCKDRMEHLEKKIAEFESIGTIEEIKEKLSLLGKSEELGTVEELDETLNMFC